MRKIKDALGRELTLPERPQRIVSLVPSLSELVVELGLGEALVGVTRFCVHPAELRKTRRVVGGTKDPKLERIRALKPDLVLANVEENRREDVEALAELPVYVTRVETLPHSWELVRDLGALLGAAAKAEPLAAQIEAGFRALDTAPAIRVAYLIWWEPLMAVGGETFIHELLASAGLVNVFAERPRYPSLSLEELRQAEPELVLLSSEPFPFREQHAAALRAALPPETQIEHVDGEVCSWYGSRIAQAPALLRSLRARLASA